MDIINCKHCNELLFFKKHKVNNKIYNKSVFIVYDKLKNAFCSLYCLMYSKQYEVIKWKR